MIGSRINFRYITRRMPEANDFDQLLRMIDAINNTIRADNDFTNQVIFKLRNDSTQLW